MPHAVRELHWLHLRPDSRSGRKPAQRVERLPVQRVHEIGGVHALEERHGEVDAQRIECYGVQEPPEGRRRIHSLPTEQVARQGRCIEFVQTRQDVASARDSIDRAPADHEAPAAPVAT